MNIGISIIVSKPSFSHCKLDYIFTNWIKQYSKYIFKLSSNILSCPTAYQRTLQKATTEYPSE